MHKLMRTLRRLEEISHLATTYDRLCLCEIMKRVKISTTADEQQVVVSEVRNSKNLSLHNSGITARKIASGDNYLGIQQNLFSQQQAKIHTVAHQCVNNKQTTFSMSSLAAEPLAAASTSSSTTTTTTTCVEDGNKIPLVSNGCCSKSQQNNTNKEGAADAISTVAAATSGTADMLKFMELIGNLKHTKRTGWVLRDINDCESISGHMYRMSMMTFLLDGSEGLNQIRCMELALVHDLAESLVGDITPFCGVSKNDKRDMEFKAMEDICKMIEPRGKRIMELFEEYETGESAESQFVKDLDRLDMVMQAFEYEKRDDCLLKHQEFFDSTRGKFKHPFVRKLVEEIYEQRDELARTKGATAPPPVHVPDMSLNNGVEKNCDASTLEKS